MDTVSSRKECLDHGCGRQCSDGGFAHIFTRLEVLEGNVLERLEKAQISTLHELMETLNTEPCAVAMAVGSLVRQGLVRSWERGKDVFVESLGH